MTEYIGRTLTDLRARQAAGEWMPCPRCRRDTMKPALHTNALSRHVEDIYICDECGTSEAMLDFMNSRPLPIENWALFRAPQSRSDLRELPGVEAQERIFRDHVPILVGLYKRWAQEVSGTDFTEYRWEAMKKCPGLTELWERPFQAKYEVADGELILRFKSVNGCVKITADLLEHTK